MDVGIRELKRRLSALVEVAARGEVIRVTHRGRPKALLVPLPGRLRLEDGISEGWLRRGSGDMPVVARRRSRARVRIADVLAEDRGG